MLQVSWLDGVTVGENSMILIVGVWFKPSMLMLTASRFKLSAAAMNWVVVVTD